MFSSQQAYKFTMDKYFPEIMSSMKKAAHTYVRCLRINISAYCRGDICLLTEIEEQYIPKCTIFILFCNAILHNSISSERSC